jgi:hypothetical protein
MGQTVGETRQITGYQNRTVNILMPRTCRSVDFIAASLLPAYWLQLMVCKSGIPQFLGRALASRSTTDSCVNILSVISLTDFGGDINNPARICKIVRRIQDPILLKDLSIIVLD